MLNIKICFLLAGWLVAASGIAKTMYVSPLGTNDITGNFPDWAGAATTISAAVAKAVSTDVIYVTNAVYTLSTAISIASNITVSSWRDGVQDPTNTIIDGNGVAGGFYINSSNAMVCGFTITNGNGQGGDVRHGGGVEIDSNGGILSNCIVVGNYANLRGGGVMLGSSTGLVTDCKIYANVLTNTGSQGADVGGGGVHNMGGTVRNCTIWNNTVQFTGNVPGGGGVFLRSDGIVSGCVISNNIATNSSSGGGVLLYSGGVLISNVITDNRTYLLDDTYYGGGGVFIDAPANNKAIMSACVVSNNYTFGSGGGIAIYHTTTGTGGYITNCTVVNNTTRYRGGGIFCRSTGNAVYYTIKNCVIRANSAIGTSENYPGGGVALVSAGTLQDSFISGNISSNDGAGILLTVQVGTLKPLIRNCQINANTASLNGGGVVVGWASSGTSTGIIDNCTIAMNVVTQASGRGGGIYFYGDAVTISNSIIYFNSAADGPNWRANAGAKTFDYSCTTPTNLVANANNIEGDPKFTDTNAANFRLTSASPCINKGANQSWMDGAVDLDGRSRIDRLSGLVDMGAYEFLVEGTLFTVR